MNETATVALVVMGALNLLWGIVAIAALYVVVRAFRAVHGALDRLEPQLRPGARKAREMLWKASQIADTVNEKADGVEAKIARVDETTEHLWNGAGRARETLNERLIPVKSFVVGVRTGARVLSQEWNRPKVVARPAPARLPAGPAPSESWRAA